MSADEIAWRIQSKSRDLIDRVRIVTGRWPKLQDALSSVPKKPPFRLCVGETGCWTSSHLHHEEEEWKADLLRKAESVLENKLSYFNLRDHFHGYPFNWNRDQNIGKDSPLCFAQSIDYRNVEKAGDCKLIWEPNRCHHIVVLGRAYRASGDIKFAHGVVEHITSWMDCNPYGRGMNWRSPMELAIRIINWAWALDFIYETKLFSGEFRERVLHSVYLHLWDVTRKYSKGSSANNHLIGEAAGVFIASCYFPYLKNTDLWAEESQQILEHEICEQTFDDGCNKELALSYHLFTLWFFIFAGLVGKKAGRDFSERYWHEVEKQLTFLGQFSAGGDALQMYGDCDDGYVLDLGIKPDDPYALLAIGAVLFKRPDLKQWACGYREPVFWLFGKDIRKKYEQVHLSAKIEELSSLAFRNAGIYLLQHGKQGSDDSISVYFDCGPLGYKSIAAHGHADALGFTLRAFGEDIFVDPGTYDYFTYPDWRTYFRSTRAHNTVEIDGQDQSVMLGPFMWGERAECKCIEWRPNENGGVVCGEYERLNDLMTHRRTLELDATYRRVTIIDQLMSDNRHDVALYFHLGEKCEILSIKHNVCCIAVGKQQVLLELDQRLTVSTLSGSIDPIGGWVSRGYHRKDPSATIIGRGQFTGNDKFMSIIYLGEIEKSSSNCS